MGSSVFSLLCVTRSLNVWQIWSHKAENNIYFFFTLYYLLENPLLLLPVFFLTLKSCCWCAVDAEVWAHFNILDNTEFVEQHSQEENKLVSDSFACGLVLRHPMWMFHGSQIEVMSRFPQWACDVDQLPAGSSWIHTITLTMFSFAFSGAVIHVASPLVLILVCVRDHPAMVLYAPSSSYSLKYRKYCISLRCVVISEGSLLLLNAPNCRAAQQRAFAA